MDDKEACHVFLQIVDGLMHIHSKNIVHRDLKPQNILLAEPPEDVTSSARRSKAKPIEVKLSDFGHSKLVRDGYTNARSHVGTPQYLAPEVASTLARYDERADLWSLGVVLYVMLTGHYPFNSSEDPAYRQGSFKFRGSGCSGRAEELLAGLIKRRPEDRLSLEQCLRSAWVSSFSEKKQRQPAVCPLIPENHTKEFRIRLPRAPKNVSSFKQELDTFSLRHKLSASLLILEDIQWNDLRRAVVIHLESMEEHDQVISHRIPTRQMCHHVINQKPCPKWTDGTHCGATWHPEFLQILEDGHPKWIWMPRQTICRTDQRSKGTRHQQGPLSCTDPNCLRAHAPNWLYAELWAFRWWVKHEFNTGLATGYTLDGDLIAMSIRTANLTLATMPYVDETYYHKFRWFAPIPQPEAYGEMMVTAPSRRANDRNEQPRRGRASTPRRHPTPRRTVTPTRPVVIRVDAPPAPAPATPTHPWLSPEQNWEEDPWTRAEREYAEQQEARAAAKASPPPAPSSTPEPTPPVTPSINPPRQHSQHRVEETPINRAFETLRQTAGSTIHSIPASMPAPSSDSGPSDLTQVATRADTNPMTQSWNLISGFPATPSPPRIPDTILGAWFERPPIQFTRQLPPTHIQGMPNVAQERFANSSAGPTIISDHLQAFLLTAINLMRLARPVGPPFELRQPEGPALASLAETLLETLQGTMTMDMKMGIATGHIGELVLEGDHNNSRLVFYRTQTWTGPPRQRSMSSTQRSHDDEVEVQSPMASSSTADVLDEATTTLIVGIKNMKESKTPQQIEDYIHKLQSLGRHMQLQQFRTWLKDQCGLPIAVRPSNLNTKEYMSKEQIEQWIEDWTTQNAQGNEQRVLKNFLLMDFAAGTDLWTLEPQQLQRLVKAFHDWEKVNFTQMVTGNNNGLLDYLEHKDSIAHLQDFLDVVLPNLHQHYICRSTDCSFVIKASHWINSATPDKQGKYLCPRCRTEYRPWAATAVNNPNKKFCPAAQCLVTKVTSATPPDSDGWAQQLTNYTTSTDTFYLYLMKFPTTNDQKLLNDCKLAVDQVATALSQSPDPQAALLEYINTVLTHAQMLPYFQQHVVSQDILNQVQQANAMRTRQPQWKWEHLPKSVDPNTRVTIYHYQGCRYEWDSEHTKVLDHADVHQLIALTFCKVYLTRFLQLSFKAQRT
eukprot:symbB.v1.2.026219.t1/scaffold2601.1/size77851/4